MKKLSKLVLTVFSVLILVAGVIINLLIIGWLDFDVIFRIIQKALSEETTNKIILIVTEFCMLFAILCIFADSKDEKKQKTSKDVLMQNDNGKLMISKETIENIVENSVSEFPGARQAITRINLDAENNVLVQVDLIVTKDVIIKDLTVNMQNKIKNAIKKTSDLDVKQVDVRIKNIVTPDSERNE